MTKPHPATGKRYPDRAFVVDAARVAAFRAALGETREVVPPTFLTTAEFDVFPAIVADPELGLELVRVLHAEQEYEHHRPLILGETLVVSTSIVAIREREPLRFVTIGSEFRDAAGEIVAVARCTILDRGSA